MDKLVIIGAGGHAKVALDIAILMDNWSEIVFLDDYKTGEIMGYSINGKISDSHLYKNSHDFFVAIGDNETRKKIQNHLINDDFSIISLLHPYAIISKYSKIGQGSIVMAGSIINPNVYVGQGTIINTNSSIDHDCNIGDFVHISPGVTIGGTSSIGSYSWIGLGSNIINNINVGCDCIIGAGSNVISDIEKNRTAFGNPCVAIKTRLEN